MQQLAGELEEAPAHPTDTVFFLNKKPCLVALLSSCSLTADKNMTQEKWNSLQSKPSKASRSSTGSGAAAATRVTPPAPVLSCCAAATCKRRVPR